MLIELFYFNTHTASCAFNDLDRTIDVRRIEIIHLHLGDLLDLSPGYSADLVGSRIAAALFDAGGLSQKV